MAHTADIIGVTNLASYSASVQRKGDSGRHVESSVGGVDITDKFWLLMLQNLLHGPVTVSVTESGYTPCVQIAAPYVTQGSLCNTDIMNTEEYFPMVNASFGGDLSPVWRN